MEAGTVKEDPSAAVYKDGDAEPGGKGKSAPAPDPEPSDGKTKDPRPYAVIEVDPEDEDSFRRVKNPDDNEGMFHVLKAEQAKEQAAELLNVEEVMLIAIPGRSWSPETFVQESKPRFRRR